MSAEPSVAAGAAALVVLLLRVMLVLGVAWCVAACFRRASAAVRHGVWISGFLLALALPLLGPILPSLEITLPASLRGGSVDPLALPSAQVASGEVIAVESMAPPAVSRRAAGPTATEPASGSAPSFATALLLVWVLGVAARLLWLVVQLARSRRLLDAAVPAPASVAAIAEIAADRLRLASPPAVLCCGKVRSPVTFGLLRSVILLPGQAVSWSHGRLEAVFLHEISHVRRGDFRWTLLVEVVCALYWPVPLAWKGRSTVLEEQERACDDAVLAVGTPPVDYADHLLEIARGLRGQPRHPLAAVAMAREAGLTRRVRAILSPRESRRPLASLAGGGAIAVLLLAAAPIAVLRAAEANSEPERPSGSLPSPVGTVDRSDPPPTVQAAAHLWIEAENGVLRGEAATWEELEASEARFVVLESGDGERSASVALSIHLAQAGRYHAWARIRTDRHPAEASVSVGGHTARLAIPEERERDGQWRWIRLTDPAEPAVLTEGIHVLSVATVAGSLSLDRLYVTGDPAAAPADRGPRQDGFSAVYRWIDLVPGPLREPLVIEFDVPTAGRYLVWGRVFGPDDDSNSLHFSVDDGPEMVWDAPRERLGEVRGRWMWDPASSRERERGTVDPVVLELTAGSHTLTLRPREEGTGIGALLVTNDLGFRPAGRPESAAPVQIWLEAEDASPGEGLRVRREGGAGGYIEAVRGNGRRSERGEQAPAVLEFEVPAPGIYSLWALAQASSDSEDSFWVRVDDGSWIRWNGIPRGEAWQWSQVRDDGGRGPLQLALNAGAHRIEIARREGGARLDRLLLTNEDLHADAFITE